MNAKDIGPGVRVCTRAGELDLDEHSNERHTAAGTWGHIAELNQTDRLGVDSWDVVFPNGAWVVVTTSELLDVTQYHLDEPNSTEEIALWLASMPARLELTYLDDVVRRYADKLLDRSGEIAQALGNVRSRQDVAGHVIVVLKTNCAPVVNEVFANTPRGEGHPHRRGHGRLRFRFDPHGRGRGKICRCPRRRARRAAHGEHLPRAAAGGVVNHRSVCDHEAGRFYGHRNYVLGCLDQGHFDALNPGGHVLGLNGYCLDAIDPVPAGCMTSCARMPTMYVNDRGVSEVERQERNALAARLIAEILEEESGNG